MPPKAARNKPSSSAPAGAAPAKVSCCICCQSLKPDKDEALFCSGDCQQWLHRYCASVSVDCYKTMKSDNCPFLCFGCYRSRKEAQLSTLENAIQDLKAEVSELRKISPAAPPLEATNTPSQHHSPAEKTYASIAAAKTGEPTSRFAPVINHTQTYHPDRKFNIILYGVDECPQGTSRADRFESDLDQAVSVLSTIESTVQPQSIKDCYRLGKFSHQKTRPRPILIKFIRITDVSKILSKRGLLSRPYLVKPDMSPEQRLAESALLKERWRLLQSGIARANIKIRNTRLYVNKKLYGQFINSKFEYETPVPSSQSDTASCPENVADAMPIVPPESHLSDPHVPSPSVVPPPTPHTPPDKLTNSTDNLVNSNSQSVSPTPNSTMATPHPVSHDHSTSQLPEPSQS